MDNGKALILGTVLKYDNAFKPSTISDRTGLSRQLTHYHLKKLIETGGLVSTNGWYRVVEREQLINQLIAETDRAESGRASNTELYHKAEALNELTDFVAACRVLDVPKAFEFQTFVLSEIDKTVSSFKRARKYMLNTGIGDRTARRILNKVEAKPFYTLLNNGSPEGFEEWFTIVTETLEAKE